MNNDNGDSYMNELWWMINDQWTISTQLNVDINGGWLMVNWGLPNAWIIVNHDCGEKCCNIQQYWAVDWQLIYKAAVGWWWFLVVDLAVALFSLVEWATPNLTHPQPVPPRMMGCSLAAMHLVHEPQPHDLSCRIDMDPNELINIHWSLIAVFTKLFCHQEFTEHYRNRLSITGEATVSLF